MSVQHTAVEGKDVSDAVPHRPGPDHGGVLYRHSAGG